MTVEDIIRNRNKFLQTINENVTDDLAKLGLEIITTNVEQITDDADYINNMGREAASRAQAEADVKVAEQDKIGQSGAAEHTRAKEIKVAHEASIMEQGKQEALKEKEIRIAEMNSEREVRVAEEASKQSQGKQKAINEQEIRIAEMNAEKISIENLARTKAATSEAEYLTKKAELDKASRVAQARANRDILEAEKEEELAKLSKQQIVQQEIEKQKAVIEAEAKAATVIAEARAEAETIELKARAKAEAIALTAKAQSEAYSNMVESVGGNINALIELTLVEHAEKLAEINGQTIASLKPDQVMIWGGGGGDGNNVSGYVDDMLKSLPAYSELWKMAGKKMPDWLISEKDEETKTEEIKTEVKVEAPVEVPIKEISEKIVENA